MSKRKLLPVVQDNVVKVGTILEVTISELRRRGYTQPAIHRKFYDVIGFQKH
jgi:hypothetical protein